MIKFLAALAGIGVAVSTVSLLVWPVLILACVYTLFSGIASSWVWIIVLAVYGAALAILARLAGGSQSLSTSIVIGGASIAALGFLIGQGVSWPAVFTAGLAGTFCFAVSAMLCGYEKLVPYGAAASVQLVWLAPLAIAAYKMSSGDLNVLYIIATIAGMIAAFFMSEAF